jgi:predicted dehydrogenase
MKNNRRNFLKLAGLSGIGLLSSCNLKGNNSSETKSKTYTLDHIRKETSINYSQIFNMSKYSAPKLNTVRIGIIGIGTRGSAAVMRLSYIEGVEIKGLCDIVTERAESAKTRIKDAGHIPIVYSGNEESWMVMCQQENIDLIYITTPWPLHAPMAVFAMEHGKHVASEIPAATTVEDCWKLVQTSEKTKKHFVMLENCCYDFFELLTLNMARQGFFGDIVHCEGAYIHERASFIQRGNHDEKWRLHENITRNGNLYPTHGLGAIAQIMNINRGNRMDYLVSTSTNDFLMKDITQKLAESDKYYQQFIDSSFRGNMNITTIRTIKGQTIMLQHDVTTPRPYSRIHLVSGTKGTALKYPLPSRIAKGHDNWLTKKEFSKLEKKYNPPIINKMKDMAIKIGGHGGMDFLMDWRLIDCLRNGLPVDINVYDAAAWSVIAPLSEWSVSNHSAPIDIPDFTSGAWEQNVPHDISMKNGGTTDVRVLKTIS